MTDMILSDIKDGVHTLTINRPEKRNAITQAMYGVMADAIFNYAEDDSIRALVITGNGDFFTAGNDLKDFSMASGTDEAQVQRFLRAILECPKPLIGAVNGPAIGIGLTMLLHFDLCIASQNATFCVPFVKLGLVPEAASSILLPATVGNAVAADMFATGRTLDAQEAVMHGLVSRVCLADDLAAQTAALAAQIAGSSPTAQKLTKGLVRVGKDALRETMQREGVLFAQQLASPDFAESVAAMTEKRPAKYA